MTHSARHAFSTFFAASRWALVALAACVSVAIPSPGFAQATVSPQPTVSLHRGFYFDPAGNLLHVEVVRNVGGRPIQPLPTAFASPKPPLPQTPPDGTVSSVFAGPNASYVIYYGPDDQDLSSPVLKAGAKNVAAIPLAFERLTEAAANRPIECATKGGDVCLFPKMCHCAGVGGCCCY